MEGLGTVLKTLRLQHNLTMRDLHKKCGVDARVICLTESGKITPKIETLSKLVVPFNISLGQLFFLVEVNEGMVELTRVKTFVRNIKKRNQYPIII